MPDGFQRREGVEDKLARLLRPDGKANLLFRSQCVGCCFCLRSLARSRGAHGIRSAMGRADERKQ
jgi:hypothetical protein